MPVTWVVSTAVVSAAPKSEGPQLHPPDAPKGSAVEPRSAGPELPHAIDEPMGVANGRHVGIGDQEHRLGGVERRDRARVDRVADVDDDVVVAAGNLHQVEPLGQDARALLGTLPREPDLRGGKRRVGCDDLEMAAHGHRDVRGLRTLDQDVIEGLLAGDAEVHLAAHVRVEVERLSLDEVRERVGAGRDGLGLERLLRPRVGHLARDDAFEIALEGDEVDDTDERALRRDLEPSAVETPVERQRRTLPRPADERRHGGDVAVGRRYCQIGPQDEWARQDPMLRSRAVHDRERHRGGDRHRTLPFREQDAHLLRRRAPELGSGVVVGEDLAVRGAFVGHAEGAVLAHSDTVPPAATGDDEERLTWHGYGRRRSRGCRRDHEGRKGQGDYEDG